MLRTANMATMNFLNLRLTTLRQWESGLKKIMPRSRSEICIIKLS